MGVPLDVVEAFTQRMVVFPPPFHDVPPRGITEFGVKIILRPMVGVIIGYTMRTPWTFSAKRQLDPVEFEQVRILIRIALDYAVGSGGHIVFGLSNFAFRDRFSVCAFSGEYMTNQNLMEVLVISGHCTAFVG